MDVNHNQRRRWVDILDREVVFAEENNEENEDVTSESDESEFSLNTETDDSGYSSNITEDEGDEIVDIPENENEQPLALDENIESAYMVDGIVESFPLEMLLELTSWSEFKRQFVDEIRDRHLAGEMEVVFERTLWVKPDYYEYWSENIQQLQKQMPNLIPNFRIWDNSGLVLNECRMSGIMSQTHSPQLITGLYRIIVTVQHTAEICSFQE